MQLSHSERWFNTCECRQNALYCFQFQTILCLIYVTKWVLEIYCFEEKKGKYYILCKVWEQNSETRKISNLSSQNNTWYFRNISFIAYFKEKNILILSRLDRWVLMEFLNKRTEKKWWGCLKVSFAHLVFSRQFGLLILLKTSKYV